MILVLYFPELLFIWIASIYTRCILFWLMLNNGQVSKKRCIWKWGVYKRAARCGTYLRINARKRKCSNAGDAQMLHIKFCSKNWHYCKWNSLVGIENSHSSACYSEIRVSSQIATLLNLFYPKEETRMLL